MYDLLELRKEMKRTYLIQRLKNPADYENPFSFGGGLIKGGFGNEAWDIIKKIYSFDYMGSAEFEWGAVPKAFRFLLDQRIKNNLINGKIEIRTISIYYICPKKYEEEVKNRIYLLKDGKIYLKKYCGLEKSFEKDYISDPKWDAQGWIEIDNGYMFFINKEMYKNSLKLFELKE